MRSFVAQIMENVHKPDAMLRLEFSNENMKSSEDVKITGHVEGWGPAEGVLFAPGNKLDIFVNRTRKAKPPASFFGVPVRTAAQTEEKEETLNFSGIIKAWNSEPSGYKDGDAEEYTIAPELARDPEARARLQIITLIQNGSVNGYVRIEY